MFLDIDKKSKDTLAAIDSKGQQISYSELVEFSTVFNEVIGKRTLIFILSENTVGSLAGYVASISSKIVPLIVDAAIDSTSLLKLITIYNPEYLWVPKSCSLNGKVDHYDVKFDFLDFKLLRLFYNTPVVYKDLSLLLSTSGSTGSPKLVRHSYSNLEQNARNVAEFFQLSVKDKPVAMLPMNYTMGLSVITSHLFAGATVLLTTQSLTDKEFWNFIRKNSATSFTGVPFSFEILSKLRFFKMDLPSLELLSQGGGKMSKQLFADFSTFAKKNNKRFIATYGQTEGTARMSYLAPEDAIQKIGSIGKPIPNGKFYLIDTEAKIIEESNISGELVYEGPNVTLGYANSLDDLKKGDEREGILKTGDIAMRDEDGFYYIMGRKSRFLKIYGLRLSLDEIENLIRSEFEVNCHCSGDDDLLKVFLTETSIAPLVSKYIVEKFGLFHKAFKITILEEIPRNNYGKVVLN